jgi:hypothetical protein
MKTLNFLVLLVLLVTTAQAQNKPLYYGNIIQLQNGWNNNAGGYLDTRGYQKDFAKTGNFLCVSTATGPKRDGGSGSWKIMSATGKAEGSPVLVNDDVYLLNQWNGNGGYLDTKGYEKDYGTTGNHLCVSTATVSNRESGSGTWKISSATGSPAGTAVTENAEIHLQNGWNKFGGGYLDTKGYQKDYAKTGNLLCVSTATSPKRDGKSGTWKISIRTNTLNAGESLLTNGRLYSLNDVYYMVLQEDGNLCVYKTSDNGFVWASMAHGFKGGTLKMQSDGNLVVYDGSNAAKWSSKTHPFNDAKFKDAKNKPVKLVLENNGTLNLYAADGKSVWSNK